MPEIIRITRIYIDVSGKILTIVYELNKQEYFCSCPIEILRNNNKKIQVRLSDCLTVFNPIPTPIFEPSHTITITIKDLRLDILCIYFNSNKIHTQRVESNSIHTTSRFNGKPYTGKLLCGIDNLNIRADSTIQQLIT